MSNFDRFANFLRRSSRKSSYFTFSKKHAKKTKGILGHFEFFFFFGSLSAGLYYISKNNDYYSETSRLIATGIASHLIVDFLTYFADKINTEVKVESFKPARTKPKDYISAYFKKEILNESNSSRRKVNQSLLGHYFNTYKGIQSGVIYLTFNSLFFYALYKNLKYELREKCGIVGFSNFFLSAGLAQLIAMTFSFPMENIKTRMQASNFNYDSISGYYKKLVIKKPMNVVLANVKKEYSGFFSHLTLYAIFEAFAFSTYETIMEYMNKNDIYSNKNIDIEQINNKHHVKEASTYQIIIASAISGVVAGVITNPIDVYQINKQMNPSFSMKELNIINIFVGVKERVYYILLMNVLTFYFLEKIGPRYFNVRLEE